jgi:hypothetical protein
MRIGTQLKCGITTLAVALASCVYGQAAPANTPDAGRAATRNQHADNAALPGSSGAGMSNAAANAPRQPLYENSAATDDRSMLRNRDDANRSAANRQGDANGSMSSSTGQQRGEIGVWLVENGGQGVRVGRVTMGGAADRAGLRSGDVILEVNGRDVASPLTAAHEIRGIPVGQSVSLTVFRDGARQQLPVTVAAEQPGQAYRVGYGGDDSGIPGPGNGIAARTARLEQQMESMNEELRQLRQQMSGRGGTTGAGGPAAGGATGVESGAGIGPMTNTTEPNSATPPQYGAGSTNPSATSTSNASPGTTPNASTTATGSAGSNSTTGTAAGTNSGTGSSAQDLFGPSSASGSASPSGTATGTSGSGAAGIGTSGAAGTSGGGAGSGAGAAGAGGAGGAGGSGGSGGGGGH